MVFMKLKDSVICGSVDVPPKHECELRTPHRHFLEDSLRSENLQSYGVDWPKFPGHIN
jgi:hypothetical protein